MFTSKDSLEVAGQCRFSGGSGKLQAMFEPLPSSMSPVFPDGFILIGLRQLNQGLALGLSSQEEVTADLRLKVSSVILGPFY
jgi:hypothetical protein